VARLRPRLGRGARDPRVGRLLELLGERFRLGRPAYGPYFFADLAETAEADEQAAIDAGEIRATRLQVVGQAA